MLTKKTLFQFSCLGMIFTIIVSTQPQCQYKANLVSVSKINFRQLFGSVFAKPINYGRS